MLGEQSVDCSSIGAWISHGLGDLEKGTFNSAIVYNLGSAVVFQVRGNPEALEINEARELPLRKFCFCYIAATNWNLSMIKFKEREGTYIPEDKFVLGFCAFQSLFLLVHSDCIHRGELAP